ncbi:MAG: D-alanyl-D-alanine carboxypeptidase, partial [Flavobacteriaceae bacterium]|nr:D-alanyl-D-alanine carboxypeptidase [Flavobacteriaceae bacterium]
DDYNNYYQAERSEMPIYGNVVQIIKDSNGEIEATPDKYKIVFDFEQRNIINRSETENKFFINPSLIKFRDTIYSPFITSRKNTTSLLENALEKTVELDKNELKDYSTLNSTQVDEIYSAILKDSDNLISESIAANISLRLNDTISVDKGLRLIQNISKQTELFDGSGLSRYNLVTPKSVISSLHDIYNLIGFERIKKIFPENYVIQNEKDFVWGKTGTLKNNHNYSGYIITDKKRIYIFSIMINHFTNDLSKIKDAIVDFLIYLKSNS